MSRRAPSPLVLRDFQREAVDRLAAAAADTLDKIGRAPAQRRRITLRQGCSLLEAPTESGKTVVLGATAERVSAGAPVAWFWFAPFAGLVEQTRTALREAAPALRVRDPAVDRADVGTRPGDVWVATWAAVAARRAETRRLRADDDVAPSLDTLVTRLREAGFRIGAVVDEAHHSFRPNTEAFRFLDAVLLPDLLLCATATPDDAELELLRRALGIGRFQRVAVSRASVVAERLNKPRVRAVSFVTRGVGQRLLDLNEVALGKAVEQHRALKAALREAHLPVVPLLLVQAASKEWTPARVREFLCGALGFPQDAVATHTADEPDPDVQALANDPTVEVLVFKMAVATGFDAPRAFTLCALRPVADPGFGLQVIGRIMRVHPLLQRRAGLAPALDTGWVFLADPEGQAGLQQAADRIRAMRDAVEVLTGDVTVYEAQVGADGRIAVVDGSGNFALVFDEATPAARVPVPPEGRGEDHDPAGGPPADLFAAGAPPPSAPRLGDTLFGRLTDAAPPGPAQAGPAAGGAVPVRPAARLPAYRYPRRPGTAAPDRLRTERMPQGTRVLMDAVVRQVRFTGDQVLAAQRADATVERQESDLFDPAQRRRSEEQAAISDLFARQNAWRLLQVSDYLDPAELGRALQAVLAAAVQERGLRPPDERGLRRALNLVLVQSPDLLREALRRAMAACAEVSDAAPLPEEWGSDVPLLPSARNLWGCVPQGLNAWEQRCADWLDRQQEVLWWARNPPRPNAADDWSVRIVLPDTGRGFYPDFVACVEGRKGRDGIVLIETKERTETDDSAAKSRTEHREYGRALMLRYDASADRFVRVEYAPDLGRNREVGPLDARDLVAG